ncbi:MAG: electron transfer flavoprotein subunit alpha/FixB family protein [Nitriliruptoraceae bacterium]
MTTLLTHVELVDETLTRLSTEALTLARGLAASHGAELHAAVVGHPNDACVERLGALGVTTLHIATGPSFDAYAPVAWARFLTGVIDDVGAIAGVGPGSDRGAEVMAHVAAALDLPLAANCVAVEPVDGGWSLTRLRWGGVLLEDAVLEADRALLTVAAHQLTTSDADVPAVVEVRPIEVAVDDDALVTRVLDTTARSAGMSLATAPVVVSGGRGVGSAEAFAVLEELAELVGGAVGCSRVATNNGWRSHSDQVGQTGTRVAPDLYIACGISGATQHWVGCMASKRILAINTDVEAPMVTRADHAVIGDLHEILPAVVAEIRARRGA